LKCFWERRPWAGGAGLHERAWLCRRQAGLDWRGVAYWARAQTL